jgi:hypothetical protein
MKRFSDYLSGFALVSCALLFAFHGGRYYQRTSAPEIVSFNDGAAVCDMIEISPRADRRDIAEALEAGADSVDRLGCINFAFVEESE